MCRGTVVYAHPASLSAYSTREFGSLQEVSEWFGNLGCKLPYGVNVADFILDLASGEFEDSRPILGVLGTERREKLIEVCNKSNVARSLAVQLLPVIRWQSTCNDECAAMLGLGTFCQQS